MRKREISKLQSKDYLSEMVLILTGSEELADAWWYLPNKAFNMKTPNEIEYEVVKDYLIWHTSASGGS